VPLELAEVWATMPRLFLSFMPLFTGVRGISSANFAFTEFSEVQQSFRIHRHVLQCGDDT
jgi:hypothetical protein